MSLRALRHFVVVAEELHMHRAAERLHIAQPALSQQIKQLELRLGVVLFSRANRRLTLTAAGEAFLHKTRLALEMADQAVLDAQRTARGEQGRLHLGYVSSAMYDSKLPGLLRRCAPTGRGLSCRWSRGMCKCSTKRCWICVWISPSSARRWPRRRTRWWSGRLYVKSSAWPSINSIRWRRGRA